MNTLSDHIVVIENAIPVALCDAVLKEYIDCDDWVPATTGDGKSDGERQCSNIGISYDNIMQKNLEVRKNLDKYLYVSAANVIHQYSKKYPLCNVTHDTGYILLKYEVNQFYAKHIDFFKDNFRVISCSFVLNDDYEGGEFAFFDRELVYKLKKGSCIMFPSNFMYPHEIVPVTSGTRYSIITWFV